MSTPTPAPDHRLTVVVCSALLGGVAMFAIVVAVVLQRNDGKGLAPTGLVDTLSVAAGATLLAAALAVRSLLGKRAEQHQGPQREWARFNAALLPTALLEAGMMLGLIAWLLNGTAVPGLVVVCVLLSTAFLILPLSPPAA